MPESATMEYIWQTVFLRRILWQYCINVRRQHRDSEFMGWRNPQMVARVSLLIFPCSLPLRTFSQIPAGLRSKSGKKTITQQRPQNPGLISAQRIAIQLTGKTAAAVLLNAQDHEDKDERGRGFASEGCRKEEAFVYYICVLACQRHGCSWSCEFYTSSNYLRQLKLE